MMIHLSKIWHASSTKTVVLHARQINFESNYLRSIFTSIKFDISQTWNEELLSLSTTTNKGFLVYGYKSPGCKLQRIIHLKGLVFYLLEQGISVLKRCFIIYLCTLWPPPTSGLLSSVPISWYAPLPLPLFWSLSLHLQGHRRLKYYVGYHK